MQRFASVKLSFPLAVFLAAFCTLGNAGNLADDIQTDYNQHLEPLFLHFHRHPELSYLEHNTASKLASELRQAGFEVHEHIGGTGVVALLKNGDGPQVMLRADMDGLPLKEKTGLPHASVAIQEDQNGQQVPVMHACGHDAHMTSLVGTARQMAARKDQWSGTLMLIGQPAEERGGGARAMRNDNIWERFGTPDYALALHVTAAVETGRLMVVPAPMSGADSVDIIIHGVGSHGAYPQGSKDPIVLGSQIVLALQTLVSRHISPREPAVVTVGAFHAGTKHNIIPDQARLQLTVRNESEQVRQQLLEGIERIALNLGRAAGLPEDKLPEVIVHDESVPPTLNDPALMAQLKALWRQKLGSDILKDEQRRDHMGAEDFPLFTHNPDIPSVYFQVGGTPEAELEAAAAGGAPVAPHHSPLFKIDHTQAIPLGVEATVTALLELLQAK
jgi:hippurate hydrolase